MILKDKSGRIVESFVFPVLLAGSLEVTNGTKFFIASLFAVCSWKCGSFSLSMLRLWQGWAILASMLWVLSQVSNSTFKADTIFFLSVALWLLMCSLTKRSELKALTSSMRHRDVSYLFAALIYVVFVSPNNLTQQFEFLAAEDNEAWVRTSAEILRSENLILDVPIGTQGIQFFVKFISNVFAQIEGLSSNSFTGIAAISSTSNLWIFLLISGLVFSQILAKQLFEGVFKTGSFTVIQVLTMFSSVILFKASVFFGHMSQSLLNTVVFAFLITLIFRKSRSSSANQWPDRISLVALSLSMFGSYNPWLVLSITAVGLVILAEFGPVSLKRVLSNRLSFGVVLVCIFGAVYSAPRIFSRFDGLHDGGGVWDVNAVPIWLAIVFMIFFFISFFKSKSDVASTDSASILWAWSKISLLSMFLFILIERPDLEIAKDLELSRFMNKSQIFGFLLVLGAIFLIQMSPSTYKLFTSREFLFKFREVFLFMFISFSFALFVWLLSRFTGLMKPMYAAQKSMLTVFAQFFWIPLGLLVLGATQLERLTRIISSLTICFLLIVSVGLSPLLFQTVNGRAIWEAQAFSNTWWHKVVIEKIGDDPDAIVVCAKSNWNDSDYSVYTCNRFLETLTDRPYPAGGFRYLAWFQPKEYFKLQDYFNRLVVKTKIIVISSSELTDESKMIFESVSKDMLEFVVVGQDS
jgi:hypothetical protein